MDTDLLFEIRPDDMANADYRVRVRRYLLGQLRIQLVDITRDDVLAPKGAGVIVREMCSCSPTTALDRSKALAEAVDPEALAATWVTPYNCEAPGHRIRLDNTQENQPYMYPHWQAKAAYRDGIVGRHGNKLDRVAIELKIRSQFTCLGLGW